MTFKYYCFLLCSLCIKKKGTPGLKIQFQNSSKVKVLLSSKYVNQVMLMQGKKMAQFSKFRSDDDIDIRDRQCQLVCHHKRISVRCLHVSIKESVIC